MMVQTQLTMYRPGRRSRFLSLLFTAFLAGGVLLTFNSGGPAQANGSAIATSAKGQRGVQYVTMVDPPAPNPITEGH